VSFDRPPVTDLSPAAVDTIRTYVGDLSENLRSGRGIWLMGDVGTGKTTLAMLVSRLALEAGHTVAIYSLPRLLSRIRRTYDAEAGEQSYLDFFERLTSVDLLHLDDLGAEKSSDWVLEQLYAIVNDRYETQRSIVVTTNLQEPELRQQIGERTVSRLAEICDQFVIPLYGADLRITG
jgi:DNA replication protein DnaC